MWFISIKLVFILSKMKNLFFGNLIHILDFIWKDYTCYDMLLLAYWHTCSRYYTQTVLNIFAAYVCQPGKFECAGVDAMDGDGCIPEIYLCDGHADCQDGHDEHGCDCKYTNTDWLEHHFSIEYILEGKKSNLNWNQANVW